MSDFITNRTRIPYEDYKVADVNLWEWGRKEIRIGKQLLNLN